MLYLTPGARSLVGLLANYNLACRIIADCARVDQVKDVLDANAAMKAYAKQAKNHKLEADSVAIRMTATRKLGEMIATQKRTVGLAKGGDRGGRKPKAGFRNNPANPVPTLAEAGIDKNLAHEARRLAALGKHDFEHQVSEVREKVLALRASGSSAAKPARPGPVARCVEIVKRAVANAAKKVPKEQVLKVLWNEIGLPEDCGPGSAGEMARKDAYIEQLENKVRQLELKIRGRHTCAAESLHP